MRRVFLQVAVDALTWALGDDRVLVVDSASWITDGRTAPIEQSLLDDVPAVARRIRVYAGCPKASVAHLTLDHSLHMVALAPPVRSVDTLILYRRPSHHDAPLTPPQVYCQANDLQLVPHGPEPGSAVVVIGGPRRDAHLPLDIHPAPDELAEAVRHTAGVATTTYLVDPRCALPWSLIARHRRAIILARTASPHHLLLAHGTDGLDHALLLLALEITEANECS